MAHYPKYQMVIDYVMDKINRNELAKDARIPSEKELCELLHVSNITVRKAMSELVGSGMIYRVKGKGSFVSDGSVPREKKQDRLAAFLFSGSSLGGNAYMQLIVNMQRHFLKHGYSLIIENTEESTGDSLLTVQGLMEKHVEGFIIYSEDPERNIPIFQVLDDKKIPFVLIDRYTSRYPTNYVGSNNHDGTFCAVRHLLNDGHTGIGFVANRIHLSSERERYEGYQDALISAGLPVNPDCLFTMEESGYERLIRYIKEGSISAVVSVNDDCAIKIIHAIRQAGLRVPDDISLIGFDDSDILKDTMIPLTTVRQYFDEIGYAAAELLVKSINQSCHDFNHIKIGTRFIIRKSTKAK